MEDFKKELCSLLNRHSKESDSDTPDFILAEYLIGSLKVFCESVNHRNTFYVRMEESESIEPCATSSENYWRERCEAAEHILLQFPYSVLQDQAEEIYNRWQQLKTALPILKNK